MAHRKCRAIMGCTEKQYTKVIFRGAGVREGLYKRPALYPNPSIPEATFEAQFRAAENAQALTNRGGLKAYSTRNTEVGKLFVMLRYSLLPQVNELYEGDRVKLQASGFGVSKDPSPQEIPEQPVIKNIVDDNHGGSFGAKIKLVRKTNPLNEKKERYTYIVQMSKDREDEDSWKIVLLTQNMYKLIIQNLKRGEEVYFRVARRNARGQSRWSEPWEFIPR